MAHSSDDTPDIPAVPSGMKLPKGWDLPAHEQVRLRDIRLLSDNWYHLYRVGFDFKRGSGEWQYQEREAYDHGNGAAILLYNRRDRSVVLTRQFRMPSFVNGNADGHLIEVPAGLLDGRDPMAAIIAEVAEETGYVIDSAKQVFDLFMSPGSVTERLILFVAEITDAQRQGKGGGLHAEGEDIAVLHLPFDEALAMMGDGRICDGKTVMLLQYAALNGLLD